MKTFEKSKEFKEQEETVSKKPQALSDDELEQVTDGYLCKCGDTLPVEY